MVRDIAKLLEQGEGLSVEFKRCGAVPEKDTFETVCSFANRQGGHILLGVNDDGSVEGVNENSVISIERNIVNVTSNPAVFSTAPGLEIMHATVQGKCVIDVWVPMGPSVYRYKGIVYDRVADVDVRLKAMSKSPPCIYASRIFIRNRGFTRMSRKTTLTCPFSTGQGN